MQRRSGVLTFLSALVPGVGYMYLGLVKKGVQFLVLFLLIEPLFRLVGLHFLSSLVSIPLWVYTFFDTFNTAAKIDRGEFVPDIDFIFNKFTGDSYKGESKGNSANEMNKKIWVISAWILIIIGLVAIINKAFVGFELYDLLRSYVRTYLIPVLFVAGGLYILYKAKK